MTFPAQAAKNLELQAAALRARALDPNLVTTRHVLEPVLLLALLTTGAIALGSRLLGGGNAEAADFKTTWTDKNGKIYTRSTAGLAALQERRG